MDTMALEVLGGPMDGLRVRTREKAAKTLIGRQVGNHLTLPFDMTISRWHASVNKEGKEFYLCDEESVSGTWIEGSRIEKIKLDSGMIIMVGGTVLEVIKLSVSEDNIIFDDNHFNNPLDIYNFSESLKNIWDKLRQKKQFFDLQNIFKHPEFHRRKKLHSYKGVKNLCRSDPKNAISDWLGQSEISPKYRFYQKDQCITPPRTWTILDMASDGNSKEINFTRFIKAVLNEQRSPAARILNEDASLVRDANNNFTLPKKRSKVRSKKSEKIDSQKRILADAFIKLETIISGFIEDAISSGLSKGEAIRPSLDLNFENVLNGTGQSDLSGRVKQLEKNLVAVLAAHRDALTLFEKELNRRLHHVIENGGHKKLFPPLSNSDTSVSSAVKRVLKDAELEGLADRIVRQTIKNKFIS